jgi:hypothetical protein
MNKIAALPNLVSLDSNNVEAQEPKKQVIFLTEPWRVNRSLGLRGSVKG